MKKRGDERIECKRISSKLDRGIIQDRQRRCLCVSLIRGCKEHDRDFGEEITII